MTETVSFTVPFPPSVNALFANIPGRGRIKTRYYKQWLKEAGWEIKAQPRGRVITGDISIDIRCPHGFRAGDIDNRVKALLDLIVSVGIIEDDRFVVDLRVRWDHVEKCTISITKGEMPT